MATGDTQPTVPLPEWESTPEPKRRVWPWLVSIGIVLALAVAAWFAAEAIARQVVTNVIRDQVKTQLSLPADQQVDVEVAGTVIPQLIAGTLTEITVASQDVAVDLFEGDVTVVARDVPIRGGDIGGATGEVVLDEGQLRALMSTVEGFPADTLALAEPDVTMTAELSLFGATVPVGVGLTPSAVEGDIVLTPASLQIGSSQVTADALRDQFGAFAEVALQDWTLCVAEYVPAGLTLTDVAVSGEDLVARFDVAGAIATDPALQANGTCA